MRLGSMCLFSEGTREAGRSKAAVTLDVYLHVLLNERGLIERIAGDASVMPRRATAAI